ncbi:hypothetical protein Tco_1570420 [Tanacetum coccineum]
MADKGKKSSMETFASNDKENYYSRITSITVNGKNAYELKGKFLDDLHNNAFSGTNGKEAVEHIEYYLKIVNPINLPNVDHDKLRIVVFPISLPEGAQRCNDINIELNKEFLEEIQMNAYHGWIDEDVVSYIAEVLEMVDLIYVPGVDSHQLRMKEELVENFFCKFYPNSYDGEEEMLDEGDNWGIEPLEFISRVNLSFDKHMKMDGRTKKVLFHAWMNGNWNKRQIDDSILRSNNTTTDLFFKPYLITHGKSDTEKDDKQRPWKQRNIDEYWWRIYKSGDLRVLES